MVKRIQNYISAFSGRQSHYSLGKSERIYLPEDFNINKIYTIFNDLYSVLHVFYETYRKIFKNDFNISFGYPRTDTCSKCDKLKKSIEKASKQLSNNPDSEYLKQVLQKLLFKRDIHQRKADTFYKRKEEARLKARKEQNFEAITSDFNKKLEPA